MLLRDALFQAPHQIYEVMRGTEEDDVLDWELIPLQGPTLAKEITSTGLADGHFILAAKYVRADGDIENAYVNLVLPERLIDYHFRYCENIVECGRGTILNGGRIIPAVAVEKFGNYDQYYVKGRAEVGLKVLMDGLAVAKSKGPVALDMAYILRDEGRNTEAIDAFSLAIDAGVSISYFTYAERAKLFQKVGKLTAAAKDWNKVRELSGNESLKYLRDV
jgi:hypothetical protein